MKKKVKIRIFDPEICLKCKWCLLYCNEFVFEKVEGEKVWLI